MPHLVVRTADGVADAAHGFVAREHGFQEVAAIAAVLRGHRPGGGHDDAAGMRDGLAMQVVHLENVRERAEQERAAARVRGSAGVPIAQDLALRGMASRQSVRERVEHEQRGRREIVVADGLRSRSRRVRLRVRLIGRDLSEGLPGIIALARARARLGQLWARQGMLARFSAR